MIRLGTPQIDIAPGEKDYAIEDAFRLSADVHLLRVYPRAQITSAGIFVRSQRRTPPEHV